MEAQFYIFWLTFFFIRTLAFNDTLEEPFLLLQAVSAGGKEEECEINKLKCNNDTDCYHRLFYVHSTCIINGIVAYL